jgi:hypothetical protein
LRLERVFANYDEENVGLFKALLNFWLNVVSWIDSKRIDPNIVTVHFQTVDDALRDFLVLRAVTDEYSHSFIDWLYIF